MPNMRSLVAAAVAGVLGALLIATLVQERDSVSASTSGIVVHIQTEIFVRENSLIESRDRPPERTVEDVWTRTGDDGPLMITATTSADGLLRRRFRFGGDADGGSERVSPEFVLQRPRSGVPVPYVLPGSRGTTEELIAALFMGVAFERGPGLRVADVRYFATFPASRSNGADGAVTAGVVGDLDAQEIELEVVVRGGLIRSKHVWALLDDGTRELIESRVSSFLIMPASRWDEIEAAVWPD